MSQFENHSAKLTILDVRLGAEWPNNEFLIFSRFEKSELFPQPIN